MEYIILSITIGMFIFNEIILFVVTDDNITTNLATLTIENSLKLWINNISLYVLYFVLAIPLSVIIIISWIFPQFSFKNKID